MKYNLRLVVFSLILSLCSGALFSQTNIMGVVQSKDAERLAWIDIVVDGMNKGATTNAAGEFTISGLSKGSYNLISRSTDFENDTVRVVLKSNDPVRVTFNLKSITTNFDEVVVSGTMRSVRKSDSPVPIEVYSKEFFRSNPAPSIFESLAQVNGVKPTINCSVCNTGDIHINGLEGPYTMILIDGMPIVSGLSTVYGLNGIPQALIERVEIVKGPASTLYGSEAVGGLINVITKSPDQAPLLSAEAFGTSWGEINADLGYRARLGDKVSTLIGVNYFNYSNPIDNNNDGFTDVTLQDRFSIFNKWNFKRKEGRVFNLAARYVYEDRWGGQMNWTPEYRGSDSIYAETIYTSRWELLGTYQLPIKEKVMFMFSANGHDQDSRYGTDVYNAVQNIGFGQFTWDKKIQRHDLLVGASMRYTFYDDNSIATEDIVDGEVITDPSEIYLPGIFIQDEWKFAPQQTLLVGMRYDYNSLHGNIFTPRINYKWTSRNKLNTLRLSAGSGYRVANVFTEDHAALTGARDVVFLSELNPETSWNGNINYVRKFSFDNGLFLNFDASVFYTYFNNKIIPDYETDPNLIIYDNLDGYAESKGISLNMDIRYKNFDARLGGTVMDVSSVEKDVRIRQEFQERYTVTWNVGYSFPKVGMKVEYTGYMYGPMLLPLISDLDPRMGESKAYSIQNIQVTKTFKNGLEIFGGVKNLLNWTPNKGNPFILARADDPFDNNVQYDPSGNILATPDNPYALKFDPDYIYGPNQGVRGFVGLRYTIK
ncbi:TonB-dependent receptor [Brumimicrobium glaciale]|uniref:TonB-dependent receptor n=1 Tax=Brumimicrobium glaciale TaxID=200475 RepID=A0A4Q4KGZ2_9FLAO|nr:TonB-dependent receptor [Brumimicrobium glaciale]RYM32503.1 TonB-dependent receptor [Brumimicrobium glaciale]